MFSFIAACFFQYYSRKEEVVESHQNQIEETEDTEGQKSMRGAAVALSGNFAANAVKDEPSVLQFSNLHEKPKYN